MKNRHNIMINPHTEMTNWHHKKINPHNEITNWHTIMTNSHNEMKNRQNIMINPHNKMPNDIMINPHKEITNWHNIIINPHNEMINWHNKTISWMYKWRLGHISQLWRSIDLASFSIFVSSRKTQLLEVTAVGSQWPLKPVDGPLSETPSCNGPLKCTPFEVHFISIKFSWWQIHNTDNLIISPDPWVEP